MSKVAIITDSSSGIMQSETNEDLFVVPMPFLIDGEEYYEGINLTKEKFYEKLLNDCKISTSQPSFDEVTKMWDKALETHEQIIYIPISSSLSESCNAASFYARENYNGKVFVVNNQRVSIVQKASVYEALELAKQGKSAEEIHKHLVDTKDDNSIYIMVPTLKYLKKGGRVTPAAAALGALLSIKPILQIHGGKLDSYAKVMNLVQAKQRILSAIKKDIETRFTELKAQNKLKLYIAHTNNIEVAEKFKLEVQKEFPDIKIASIDELALVVACHIGAGSIALAVTRV